MDFAVLKDDRVKIKERERRDKYLYLARELKKVWNIRVTVIPIAIGVLGMILKGLGKKIGGIGNQKKNRDIPVYSIVEIDQNTEKAPRDLKKPAVTQTPMKDHHMLFV